MKAGKKDKISLAIIIIFPFICMFASLFIGRYPISITDVISVLSNQIFGTLTDVPQQIQVIIMEIRLPRALMGALVGGALSVSGAAFQSLFGNPLVNSGVLGVSSGAGFGAALGIIIFNSFQLTFVFAFVFGCAAVLLSFLVGRIYNTTTNIMLILGGMVVSSIFSALVSLLKYVSDPANQLPAIVFWLMGSLASINRSTLFISAIPIILGMLGIFVMRWRLNILSMGDTEAQALGINVNVNKAIIVASATLATAGAVCAAGVIGWVGLVMPHIGRMIVGNNNKVLVPASIFLGAAFMIIVDTVARTLTSSEIPLGIITAIIGGPFFIYLLKKTKGGGFK